MIKSLKDLLDKLSRFTNSLVYDGGICKRLSRVNFSLNAINFAVCLDDIKSLEILLKCGLSVDTLDEIGTSPLIYAILYNKKKSAEFLIKSGADLELEDFMGNCAKFLLHSK